MIKKLLIANRGEIAIRIARAAADSGITTVAIHPADDALSLHVRVADEAIEIPGDTDDIWYDAGEKRLYVSTGAGYLAVIRQVDPDHYETVARVPTERGARTCLYDPASRRLYLVVPRHLGHPEIWVYQVTKAAARLWPPRYR